MGERLDVYETANDYIELWDDRWRRMEACRYVTAPLRVICLLSWSLAARKGGNVPEEGI